MVTVRLTHRCILCGYRCRGLEVQTVRVLVRSVRSVGVGLVAVDRSCAECGWPTGPRWDYAGLDPADEAAVLAARERLRKRRKGAAA